MKTLVTTLASPQSWVLPGRASVHPVARPRTAAGAPKTRRFAAQGSLMAYGAAISDLFQQAATYVDRILHGAKPSELPVGFPTKSRR